MTEQQPPPTEEEMRAAYEAEMKRIRVEDVVLQTVVSLVNLGGRKAGMAGADPAEKDLEQVRLAVEATRALLPLVEAELGPDAAQVRNALSQLQMAYAQQAGGSPPSPAGGPSAGPPPPAPGAPPPGGPAGGRAGAGSGQPPAPGEKPGEGDSAVSSGRLWIPGQ